MQGRLLVQVYNIKKTAKVLIPYLNDVIKNEGPNREVALVLYDEKILGPDGKYRYKVGLMTAQEAIGYLNEYSTDKGN